ncbi:hypothetical protein OG930_03790 [Streptomyces sp. NBC_01799]|nr:hypothetical protein OG930_03790 [Streptomyces sp. NBC_01799]
MDLGGQASSGSTVRPADGAPFSAGGGGMLVCADRSGVDLDQPIDVTGRIGLGLDWLESVGEDALQGVSAEAGADRFPRAVAFRQVTPGDAGADLVDHALDDLTVVNPRSSGHGPGYMGTQ